MTLWNQWDGKYLEPITDAFNDYMAANPCVAIDLTKPDDVQSALNTAIPAVTAALNNTEVQAGYLIAAFGKSLNTGVPMSNSSFQPCQWSAVEDATLAVWQGRQDPKAATDAEKATIDKCVAGVK